MSTLKLLAILFVCSLLGACATPPTLMPTAEFAPVMPIPEPRNEQVTGAIFNSGRGLFGTHRVYQPNNMKVGDLITVEFTENMRAGRSGELNTSRESENDVLSTDIVQRAARALGVGGGLAAGLSADQVNKASITNSGSGTASQTQNLAGKVTAMVVEIFANGNMMIVGEKQLAFTEGSEFVRIKGIIRPADIQPNNTVLSDRIANAQISYRGDGELSSVSKNGWGTKLLYNLWPF